MRVEIEPGEANIDCPQCGVPLALPLTYTGRGWDDGVYRVDVRADAGLIAEHLQRVHGGVPVRAEIAAAWFFLVVSVVGWPLSVLWLATSEPPFTLSLSWLAILIEAAVYLKASRAHRDQEATET